MIELFKGASWGCMGEEREKKTEEDGSQKETESLGKQASQAHLELES